MYASTFLVPFCNPSILKPQVYFPSLWISCPFLRVLRKWNHTVCPLWRSDGNILNLDWDGDYIDAHIYQNSLDYTLGCVLLHVKYCQIKNIDLKRRVFYSGDLLPEGNGTIAIGRMLCCDHKVCKHLKSYAKGRVRKARMNQMWKSGLKGWHDHIVYQRVFSPEVSQISGGA